ncbi:hypothetical protein [Saccharothrix sp. Mg75]|uniref:hypothetical protein n=1 Tax=Saccharothrix sp. Mg75 TaxID=3445357 RepID=UPI003EEC5015
MPDAKRHDLEDELRELGRALGGEPDDAAVTAILAALGDRRPAPPSPPPAPPPVRRAGLPDNALTLAAAALVVLVVLVLGVRVVPGLVRPEGTSTHGMGGPGPAVPSCAGWGGLSPATVDGVERRSGWRPPTGGPWGRPLSVAFAPTAEGRGITVAVYRVAPGTVTLERYPKGVYLSTVLGGAAPTPVPLDGATAEYTGEDTFVDYQLSGVAATTTRLRCTAPRLTWTTAAGVTYAVSGRLPTPDHLVELARAL